MLLDFTPDDDLPQVPARRFARAEHRELTVALLPDDDAAAADDDPFAPTADGFVPLPL